MSLKPGTLVEVCWHDAYMSDDDAHLDSSVPMPPAIEFSVGYVYRDDRAAKKLPALVIAMSMHDPIQAKTEPVPTRQLFRDRLVIPSGMIQKVRRLT